MIILFEEIHHIPGFGPLNAFGADHFGLQVILLITGAVIYFFMTLFAYTKACLYFEHIDL